MADTEEEEEMEKRAEWKLVGQEEDRQRQLLWLQAVLQVTTHQSHPRRTCYCTDGRSRETEAGGAMKKDEQSDEERNTGEGR